MENSDHLRDAAKTVKLKLPTPRKLRFPKWRLKFPQGQLFPLVVRVG